MMNRVLRAVGSQRRAIAVDIPPPAGGLDTFTHPAVLDESAATVFENWFTEGSKVQVRSGYEKRFQIDPSAAPSLMSLEIGSGSVLLAAAGGKITRLSTGAVLESGFASDRWIAATQSGYLFMVNGSAARLFSGAALSVPNLTGAATTWDGCVAHNERIYLWKTGSTDFWYLDPAAIQGRVSKFPLGNLGNVRGGIAQIATWTYDAGHGANDILVILTEKGDVILYEGIDPGDPADWRLTGRYKVAAPVPGGRCAVKVGADLAVMTQEGVLSMTGIMAGEREAISTRAYSQIVHPTAADLGRITTAAVGQAIADPAGRMVVFNYTSATGAPVQLVRSVSSGRWSMFTGIPAVAWAEFQNRLWFLTATGEVNLFWEGSDDNGAEIWARYESGRLLMAAGEQFNLVWVKPVLKAPAGVNIAMAAAGDFDGAVLPAFDALDPETVDPPTDPAQFVSTQIGVTCHGARAQIRQVLGNRKGVVEWLSTSTSIVRTPGRSS
jgi:hypothetical protein